MPRKAKETVAKAPETRHRSSWRGPLNFGLVTIPVEAFNAINRDESDIHFHQLHAKCHSRIKYQKVCPIHGPVPANEIVSGFEARKGKYAEFDPDELNALRTERERGLTVDSFVPPEAVDPLYFDGRMYYLLPAASASQEAFDVVVKAMESEGRCGVGRIVMSGKDQIVLLRPLEGLLHMAMLNYAAEIKPPKSLSTRSSTATASSKHLKIAKSLVQQWTEDDFDFTKYEDHYRQQVQKLIKAKIKGKEIEAPKEEEEAPQVLNLMDALQKSLAQAKKPARPARARRQSQKSTKARSA